MAQFFEFIASHFILVSIFVVLLFAFFVNEGRQGGSAISPTSLVTMVNRENALILDVRDSNDFGSGHIVNSVNIPFSTFDTRVAELDAEKERPVVVVCKIGQHSGSIGKKLKARGFENVRRLSGGIAEWTGSNLPLVK